MLSFKGLKCFIRAETAYHLRSKDDHEHRETEEVPEVYSSPSIQSNTITSVITPKPSWFEICLEVLGYISEYLVVEVIIDGRKRGTIVNEVAMKEENFKGHSKAYFDPIGGVQYIRQCRTANPPYAWMERAWRFDDIHRARIRTDSGPNPSELGTIIVKIRKAARVITAQYHTQLSSYSQTNSSQEIRYRRTAVTDQGVQDSGITHLVMFGSEKKSNDRLQNGRKSSRLTDTFTPIDRFTYWDDESKPYAEFRFQYRSIEIFAPGSLSRILDSVPLALHSALMPLQPAGRALQQVSAPNQQRASSLIFQTGLSALPTPATPAPSIALAKAEKVSPTNADPDAAIAKLEEEMRQLKKRIEVQKQCKAVKERRAKKEALRKRQAEIAKRQGEMAKQQSEMAAELARLEAEMKELGPEDGVDVKMEVDGA